MSERHRRNRGVEPEQAKCDRCGHPVGGHKRGVCYCDRSDTAQGPSYDERAEMADIGVGLPVDPHLPPVEVVIRPTKARRKAQLRALTERPREMVKAFRRLSPEQRRAQLSRVLEQLDDSYSSTRQTRDARHYAAELRAHQAQMTDELMKLVEAGDASVNRNLATPLGER